MHISGGMIVRQTLHPVFRPTNVVPGSHLSSPQYSWWHHGGLQSNSRGFAIDGSANFGVLLSLEYDCLRGFGIIAEQMGHNSAEMLQKVYGKWIESAGQNGVDSIWSAMQRTDTCPNSAPEFSLSAIMH